MKKVIVEYTESIKELTVDEDELALVLDLLEMNDSVVNYRVDF